MSPVKELSQQPKTEETVRPPEPMHVERQAPTPSHDDDELEIPAFLRRY
jgi:hypothetical protein